MQRTSPSSMADGTRRRSPMPASPRAGHEGFALQYWFCWVYNQLNDLHEGDWERVQLGFDGDHGRGPEQGADDIILFQHEGGERGRLGDPKLQKEGDAPVVYPAEGSHATYYTRRSTSDGQRGAGVGCDNTSSRSATRSPRRAAAEPRPATATRTRGWATRAAGASARTFNNGPTGPATKTVWRAAVHVDVGAAHDEPAPPRRLDRRASGHRRLLRRRRLRRRI